MTVSAYCPRCGTGQVQDALFCVKCGAKLAPPPVAETAPLPVSNDAPPAPAPGPVQVFAPAPTPAPAPALAVQPPPWSQPAPAAGFQAGPAPAAGYQAPGQPRTGAARPTGISILAILEVAGGVLGLLVAKALFDYADARNYWYGAGSGGTAGFVGLCSAAGAITGFVVAWGLWSVRPWAWLVGAILSAASAGSAILSLAGGGGAVWAVITIGVDVAVLYYLNTNEVRALFGRPPSTFMQSGH
jgi:hypothetical protein